MTPIEHTIQRFSISLSYKDFGFMTWVLVTLNLLDVFLSFYAISVLAFVELNPLVVGFPIWIYILKFGVCFVPVVCAYVLDKFGMKNYFYLPFICSVILIEFYTFVVAFNMRNILGV